MEFKYKLNQSVWLLCEGVAKKATIQARTFEEAIGAFRITYTLDHGPETHEDDLYETPEALIRGIFERAGVDFKGGKHYTAPVEKDPIGKGDFVAEFETPKSYSPPEYGPITAYSKFDDGAWYTIQCNAANDTKLSKPCAGCGKGVYGVSHITGIDLFCKECWRGATNG